MGRTFGPIPIFNYDKVGHFAQGFVPGLVTRELRIRLGVVQKKAWVNFLVVCVALVGAIIAVLLFSRWQDRSFPRI